MERVHRYTQAYSQAPWRKQMQWFGLFLLVLVFSAIVAGIYLSVTARAAAVGREIQSMQDQITALKQENEDLQAQLAMITSSDVMQERARALGFERVGTEETLYLLVPGYSERQPVVLAPSNRQALVSAPVLPPEYTESLFEWLRKQAVQSYLPRLSEVLP